MDRPLVREDPRSMLAGARSVVVCGLGAWRPAPPPGPGEGRLARFAAIPDYHSLIRSKLEVLLGMLRAAAPCGARITVDAEPVLERALARRAGLGWAGQSSCLVSPAHGPWLLLGEIIVDIELEPGIPVEPRCGDCGRCAAACPTGAIISPGVVDAGRCVAYLTIEHRGPVPEPLRPGVGRWLFGCDACQEACPHPGTPAAAPVEGVLPATMQAAPFLSMTEGEFRARYAGTALLRAGRARMARNAAVVLGNAPDASAVAPLRAALHDPDPAVRDAAGWALGRPGAAPGTPPPA